MLHLLKIEELHNFCCRIRIRANSSFKSHLLIRIKNVQDILIAVIVLTNKRQLGINTIYEICKGTFNLIFCSAALNIDSLAMDVNPSIQNCIRDQFLSTFFISRSLLLSATNDCLNCLWKLSNIATLNILSNLHCALDLFKVRILIREHKDSFVICRLQNQHLIAASIKVRCYCQNSQLHRSS